MLSAACAATGHRRAWLHRHRARHEALAPPAPASPKHKRVRLVRPLRLGVFETAAILTSGLSTCYTDANAARAHFAEKPTYTRDRRQHTTHKGGGMVLSVPSSVYRALSSRLTHLHSSALVRRRSRQSKAAPASSIAGRHCGRRCRAVAAARVG